MARLYGYEPGHLPLVSDLVARVHSDDRDRVWQAIQAARTQG